MLDGRYVNNLAKDVYNAGVSKGHEDHYIESHELANGPLGKFQRRVMLALNALVD